MEGLIQMFSQNPAVQSILEGLGSGVPEQAVIGVSGSLKTLVVATVRRLSGRPLLVVTSDFAEAGRLAEECRTWLGRDERAEAGGEEIRLFPHAELMPYGVIAQSESLANQRLKTINALLTGERPIIIVPAPALLGVMQDPVSLREAVLEVRVGMMMDPGKTAERLITLGYERLTMVEGIRQFAVRGGILDVFPPTGSQPIRIEFFGDEVSSIREFDPLSQRSLREVSSVVLGPAREFLPDLMLGGERKSEALHLIEDELRHAAARLDSQGHKAAAQRLRTRVGYHLEQIKAGAMFEGVEQYLPYFQDSVATVADYLPKDCVVIIDEFSRSYEAATRSEEEARETLAARLEQGAALPGQGALYIDADMMMRILRRFQVVYMSILAKRIQGAAIARVVSLEGRPAQSYHGQWKAFLEDMKRRVAARSRVVCLISTPERASALSTGLKQDGLDPVIVADLDEPPAEGVITVTTGHVGEGFEIPRSGLVVVTDLEVYGKVKRMRPPQPARRRVPADAFDDIKPGDYVVHVNHGIGRYLGVKTLEVEGVQRDYLFIKYAGADALYVPTDQSHLVHRYIGVEGQEPRLNKLGGTEWARTKNRVRESVREMARELLHLYAVRQASKGFQFSPDTPWQREFEDSFKYEETPDQRQATEEIKRDMERPRPMDRLLCGDVGYGKTEVAMRAAFKAVTDSKQVAVLVPTTILAQQHYNTFRERFEGYPVTIEVLSRFRSQKEQDRIIRDLRLGKVDIIIGTHRLLQDDIGFKDLGLLIVDEEHRFGVAHKERIKKLKETVDVLTLSATPIPRTLHMALTGFRDMSIIETPPEDRFPVQTYVIEHSDDLIREAITRELARGGQVFYVHNRVQTIERAAARVQALVPEARVAVAHGQMKEDRLERTMLRFLDGEFDVLVCTTIIESGLDIANVNTLIVEDADQMGLAQLYQLRGRVGRSNRLAYAYLFYRRDRILSEVAEKRLEAIREFTELGSGFKIAMRDLEIRGAGNILGPEQHGFIASVGFDLYCRMLEQAVREIKGEEIKEPPQVSIEIPVDAYLPDSYVPDSAQKVDLYKRIVSTMDLEEARAVAEEMVDRFGPMPGPAWNLIKVARIKVLASSLGISALTRARDRVYIKIGHPEKFPLDKLQSIAKQYKGKLLVPGRGTIHLKVDGLDRDGVLSATETLLRLLAGTSYAATGTA